MMSRFHFNDTSESTTFIYTGGKPDHNGRGITHLTVQDGVQAIVSGAFIGWRDLVSVRFKSSVTRISKRAFFSCKSLEKINLPGLLQIIGDDAFFGCSALTAIVFPNSLVNIGRSAFCQCSSLLKVTIPSSIVQIDSFTFGNCTSLRSIKLAIGIQKIGCGAFAECESLESIQIPPSTQRIEADAFKNCYSLKVVHMPSSLLKATRRTSFSFDQFLDLIILTDTDDFVVAVQHPTFTLGDIEQCIENIPNDVPVNEQVGKIQQVLQQFFPEIAHRAQNSGFNLLNLMLYFPGDVSQVLATLLDKCPEALSTVDYNGLIPFMMAAEACTNVEGLNTIYNLLCLDPSVLDHYRVNPGCVLDDDTVSENHTIASSSSVDNGQPLELTNEREGIELRSKIEKIEKEKMKMEKRLREIEKELTVIKKRFGIETATTSSISSNTATTRSRKRLMMD